jgi:murein L,D-transpeptidase YcbB/YkuD
MRAAGRPIARGARTLGALAGFVIVALALALGACGRRAAIQVDREVTHTIARITSPDTSMVQAAGDSAPDVSRPEIARELVRRVYHARHGKPLWVEHAAPNAAAREMLQVLEALPDQGLDPAVYAAPAIAGLVDSIDAPGPTDTLALIHRLAHLDVRLTLAYLRLADALSGGRVPHEALDPDWGMAARAPDPLRDLPRLIREGRVRASLDSLSPPQPEYWRLREALARFRVVALHGGWSSIGAGPTLGRGSAGERVVRLRRRLAATGELGAADTSGARWDRALERAVRAFQERQGLEVTGKVDDATRRALDVPAAERVHQLALNLERWRWLRVPLEPRSARVNIPEFMLAMWDSGRVVGTMPVVVGQRGTPTPIFTDRIDYIVVNPKWRLPKSVLDNEVLPEAQRDTAYWSAHKLRIYYTKAKELQEVGPLLPIWTHLWQDSFPFIVAQDAGPENPLGRIKFMCPNEYDVYLHDSNAPGLFSKQRRAYSHGCVRIGRPMDFAAFVLGDTSAKLAFIRDSLLVTGAAGIVRVDRRVPVHVLYWTAWTDSAGRVSFRDDLYGYDAKLDSFLTQPRGRTWTLNPDSLRSAWRAQQKRDLLTP